MTALAVVVCIIGAVIILHPDPNDLALRNTISGVICGASLIMAVFIAVGILPA